MHMDSIFEPRFNSYADCIHLFFSKWRWRKRRKIVQHRCSIECQKLCVYDDDCSLDTIFAIAHSSRSMWMRWALSSLRFISLVRFISFFFFFFFCLAKRKQMRPNWSNQIGPAPNHQFIFFFTDAHSSYFSQFSAVHLLEYFSNIRTFTHRIITAISFLPADFRI